MKKRGSIRRREKKFFEKIKEAESKRCSVKRSNYQKQLLQEYVVSSQLLAISPFFKPEEKNEIDRAEVCPGVCLPPSARRGEQRGRGISAALCACPIALNLYISRILSHSSRLCVMLSRFSSGANATVFHWSRLMMRRRRSCGSLRIWPSLQ